MKSGVKLNHRWRWCGLISLFTANTAGNSGTRRRFVPDEGGFPGGVLADQQHHGLALEVGGLQRRGVEVMEEVGLLQRQQLLSVQGLQPLRHRLVHLSFLVASTLLLFDPAEHAHRPARFNPH